MLIDWFTVVAQLVNFAILVVALKFLLYDRLMDVMEARRRSIAQTKAEADERIGEAEEELTRLREERRALERQREDALEEVRRETGDKRRELLQQARTEVEAQEQEWLASVRSRQERLSDDIQRLTGEKSVNVARRLLADMADRSLEEAMVGGLVDRVAEIADEDRSAIVKSVRSGDIPIVVRTAFDPSATTREAVDEILWDLVGDRGHPVTWERDPQLIAGIVVQVGSHTVGWSVAGYLDEVEQEFTQLLQAEVGWGAREGDG